MAEFTEVLKQRKRMCRISGCSTHCLLHYLNNKTGSPCDNYILEYPEEAEEIIMEWAKEHPIMTNAQKFKEVFGINKPLTSCEGFYCESCYDCDKCRYKDFWNREYKEPEQED